MKTKKVTVNNEEIWLSAEECLSSRDRSLVGYISFWSTQQPGPIQGEAVKDENLKYIIFESEDTALDEAEKYYIYKML